MIRTRFNRGVALITAILITALAGTVAAGLAWDSALDMRRTMVLLYRDQAYQVALGAESWLQSILRQDLEDSDSDHLGEIWASDLPGLPIEGGEVFGRVEDLQGRFNINNLIGQDGEIDQPSLEQFRRLLTALGIDPRFAGIAADWIDANQDAEFPDGAEDPIYTGLIPPYRTANQTLSNVSELAALEGIDKAIFDTLLPHIVALPGRTAVNVNTATAAVLQSLDEEMSAADVERLLAERAESGFADISGTFSSIVKPDVLNQLTYFSLLERGPRGDVTPILRSLGTT